MTDLGHPPAASPVPGSPPGSRPAAVARLGVDTALITLGTAFVGAAVLLSTVFTHRRGSLDASNFVLGLLGTLGLLGIAAAAYALVQQPERRTALAAYPGAVGTAAAGLVVLTAADFDTTSQWLAGLVTLVLAGVGCWLTRQVPYAVAATCGLALVAARLLIRLTGLNNTHLTSGHLPSHLLVWISLGLWVFAGVVTAAAWFLPGRHVVAVWIGSVALGGNIAAMVVLYLVELVVRTLLGPLDDLFDGGSSSFYSTGDVVVTVIFAAVAMLVWTVLYLSNGVAGYRVLILAAGAFIPTVAAVVIAISHPSIWELVLGVVGGAILVGVLVLSLRGRTPEAPTGAPPASPPPGRETFGPPVDGPPPGRETFGPPV